MQFAEQKGNKHLNRLRIVIQINRVMILATSTAFYVHNQLHASSTHRN